MGLTCNAYQLEQDVKEFWNYMVDKSKIVTDNEYESCHCSLPSKIVGRWPSGAPLTCSPDHDDPSLAEEMTLCLNFRRRVPASPFGAHIASG